jgi:integrase
VPLDPTVVAVLRKHRTAQKKARLAAGAAWAESGLVFTDAHGAGLHPDAISRRFRLLRRVADLPPVRLHALRHGVATRALSVGVDMQVVSEILGHSSVSFTRDVYTAVFPDLKHEAAAQGGCVIGRRSLYPLTIWALDLIAAIRKLTRP